MHHNITMNVPGCDRIQPDILNAFKSNPYTHSLTTFSINKIILSKIYNTL